MKRIVLIAGLALTIFSCAQHDSSSPDTSGNDPQQPNESTNMDSSSMPRDTTNMNNNGSNYSEGVKPDNPRENQNNQ